MNASWNSVASSSTAPSRRAMRAARGGSTGLTAESSVTRIRSPRGARSGTATPLRMPKPAASSRNRATRPDAGIAAPSQASGAVRSRVRVSRGSTSA